MNTSLIAKLIEAVEAVEEAKNAEDFDYYSGQHIRHECDDAIDRLKRAIQKVVTR
jgi:hypothetical protein